MDQTHKLPSIVQALCATATTQQIAGGGLSAAATTKNQSQPSISRCTRSQSAPDWTVGDTLALIGQIAAVDSENWSKSLSAFQKWKIISYNCSQFGINRPSNQCKRRWESLISDYRRIRRREARNGNNGSDSGSYWGLDPETREKLGLPVLFDQEVYSAMDAIIKVEEAKMDGKRDSDCEELVVGPTCRMEEPDDAPAVGAGVADADAGSTFDREEETKRESSYSSSKAWELAVNLKENAEHIQSLLRGQIEQGTVNNQFEITKYDLTKSESAEIALAERKAEELIESFGGLVGALDQFTKLIKECGFENVVSMN